MALNELRLGKPWICLRRPYTHELYPSSNIATDHAHTGSRKLLPRLTAWTDSVAFRAVEAPGLLSIASMSGEKQIVCVLKNTDPSLLCGIRRSHGLNENDRKRFAIDLAGANVFTLAPTSPVISVVRCSALDEGSSSGRGISGLGSIGCSSGRSGARLSAVRLGTGCSRSGRPFTGAAD